MSESLLFIVVFMTCYLKSLNDSVVGWVIDDFILSLCFYGVLSSWFFSCYNTAINRQVKELFMHSQFYLLKSHHFDDSQLSFQKCILVGNWLMILSLIIVSACLLITFAFEQYFSIGSQIVAHICTIIFAALVKLGYVIRCIGVHGLGCRV